MATLCDEITNSYLEDLKSVYEQNMKTFKVYKPQLTTCDRGSGGIFSFVCVFKLLVVI